MENKTQHSLFILLQIKQNLLKKLTFEQAKISEYIYENEASIKGIHQNLIQEAEISFFGIDSYSSFKEFSLRKIENYRKENDNLAEKKNKLLEQIKIVFKEIKTFEILIRSEQEKKQRDQNKAETMQLDEISLQKHHKNSI